jgi:hypothetical protein
MIIYHQEDDKTIQEMYIMNQTGYRKIITINMSYSYSWQKKKPFL